MTDRILTLAQVADEKIVPLSKTTLYHLASTDPDSPFRKRGGKWMAIESDLRRWVREGPRVRAHRAGDPMPQPKSGRLIERVREFNGKK